MKKKLTRAKIAIVVSVVLMLLGFGLSFASAFPAYSYLDKCTTEASCRPYVKKLERIQKQVQAGRALSFIGLAGLVVSIVLFRRYENQLELSQRLPNKQKRVY
jgi:hypothetical protein